MKENSSHASLRIVIFPAFALEIEKRDRDDLTSDGRRAGEHLVPVWPCSL